MREWEEGRMQARFAIRAQGIAVSLRHGVENHLCILKPIKGFLQISEPVTREEYDAFCQEGIPENLDFQAVAWVPRVMESEREAFESRAGAEGIADFQITERDAQGMFVAASARDEYYPVYYTWPMEPNREALGFDIGSEPERAKAITMALDSGEMAATSMVKVVASPQNPDAIVVLLPVFRPGMPADSQDERRENLIGFIIGVFRISNLVEDSLNGMDLSGLDIHIHDLTPGSPVFHLYRALPKTDPGLTDEQERARIISGIHSLTSFELAGRDWEILVYPTAGYMASQSSIAPSIFLAGALLLTLLATGYLLTVEKHTERAERLVAVRTRELRESKERLDAIVGNTPDVSVQGYDIQGRVLYWNRASEKTFGWTQEEALGKTLDQLILNEQETRAFVSLLQQIDETGQAVGPKEWKFTNRQGRTGYLQSTIFAISLAEGGKEFICMDVDITQRKRAEQSLREVAERREELERIVNSSQPVAFLWKAEQGSEVEFVSENVTQFGYTPDDFYSGRIKFTEIIHPSDRARASAEVGQFRKEGGESFSMFYRILTKDGQARCIEDRTSIRRNEKGEITHHEGIVLDITEQKLAQDEIVRINKELQAAVKAEADFVSMVSHELRAPLVPIVGYSELLLDGSLCEMPQEALEPLQAIRSRAQDLAGLVDDLLTLSKIERGRLRVDIEPLSISEQAGETIRDFELGDHGKEVVMRWEGEDFKVSADHLRLHQILRNLISNAIKYSKDSVHIVIRTEKAGEMGLIHVEDDGIGIPEKYLEHLFDRFFQVDSVDKPGGGGIGLGLAITQELTELMGGGVTVKSEAGKGSTFTVRLPLA
jgi:PAS domain S-box-containing protein